MSIALDPRQILDELRPPREAVRRRLIAVRRRLRQHLAMEGLAWTAAAVGLSFVGTLSIDWMLRLGLPSRIVILIPLVAAILLIAYRRLFRPLRWPLTLPDIALLLDRVHPGVSQGAAAVIELPDLIGERIQASPGMVRAAVLEQARVLEQVDWAGCFDEQRKARFDGLLSLAVLLPTLLVTAFPQTGKLWVSRWLLGSEVRWPQRNYLAPIGIEPGQPLLVPRGEAISVQVEAQPAFVRETRSWRLPGRNDSWLASNDEPPQGKVPEQVVATWKGVDGAAKQGNFTRIGESRFRCELPPVLEPLSLHFRGGDDWLGPIEVRPLDRPTIESLTLTAKSPGESETQTFDAAQSQLLFLLRTELTLRIVARRPLADATLAVQAGAAPKLERIDDRTYSARWTMRQ